MFRIPSPLAALAAMTLFLPMLGGCTVNTYPDGSREAQWGVPQDVDDRDSHRPGTFRDETGEIRGQTQLPER